MSIAFSPGRGKRRSFWWSRCRSTSLAKARRCPRSSFRLPTEDATRAVVYTQEVVLTVGTWLSLVEHSLGVRGVGSSNLPVPTIQIDRLLSTPEKLAGWFPFFPVPAVPPNPACLHQHERQGHIGVLSTVALAAAHWVLQQQQSFYIPKAEP